MPLAGFPHHTVGVSRLPSQHAILLGASPKLSWTSVPPPKKNLWNHPCFHDSIALHLTSGINTFSTSFHTIFSQSQHTEQGCLFHQSPALPYISSPLWHPAKLLPCVLLLPPTNPSPAREPQSAELALAASCRTAFLSLSPWLGLGIFSSPRSVWVLCDAKPAVAVITL